MQLFTISTSILDSLKSHQIFPDVLDDFEPQGLLTISYGGANEVAMGNTLKVSDTKEKPTFQLTLNTPSSSSSESTEIKVNEADLFTLVMTDPDAPSRTDKKWSEYAHYISTNITLESIESSQSDSEFISSQPWSTKGDEILPYYPPGPPPGTGKHRYVFILFKQGKKIDAEPLKGRPNWGYGVPATGVRKWAGEHSLVPFAVNFFQAEHE